MEEEKVINFTTQNSFLHYGRKGMKWGKNIFGDAYDQSIKKTLKNAYKNGEGGAQRYFNPTTRALPKHYFDDANISKTGKAMYKTAAEAGYIKEQVKKMPKVIKNQADSASKQWDEPTPIAFAKEIKDAWNDYKSDSRQNDVDDELKNQNKTERSYEERKKAYNETVSKLDKYENAFKSIEDMDEKYSKKLFDKYIDKIQPLADEFFDLCGEKAFPKIKNVKMLKAFFERYNESKEVGNYED